MYDGNPLPKQVGYYGPELTENNPKIENSVTTLAAPRRGLVHGFLTDIDVKLTSLISSPTIPFHVVVIGWSEFSGEP
jgi:hypothetical protein